MVKKVFTRVVRKICALLGIECLSLALSLSHSPLLVCVLFFCHIRQASSVGFGGKISSRSGGRQERQRGSHRGQKAGRQAVGQAGREDQKLITFSHVLLLRPILQRGIVLPHLGNTNFSPKWDSFTFRTY